MSVSRPPTLAAWLLGRLVPAKQRPEILGDLEENYRLRAERFSPAEAWAWYWTQVLTIPIWLWREEVGTVISLSWQETRYALRNFRRKPGFTAITVGTLALAIGANTAIFSVVDGVLLEPLPFPSPNELVTVSHTAPGLDLPRLGSATGLHTFYSETARNFVDFALYAPRTILIATDGPPQRIPSATATPSLFPVLGVSPLLGRSFSEEEGLPEGPEVVVISHGYWSEVFASDPSVIGRTIESANGSLEIIGVMPPDFAFPDAGVRMWTPLRVDPTGGFGGFNFAAVARLAPDVTVEDAYAELHALRDRLPEQFPIVFTPEMIEQTGMDARVNSYLESVVGDVRTVLWVIMATVGFVLLIACANVANLLLVRAEGRSKEIAVRTALGASRDHLLTQSMTESAVLSTVGALLGVLLARLGLGVLLSRGPQDLPRLEQIGIDGSVLFFTAGVTVLSALVFGAIPVVRNRTTQAAGVLRDGSRGATAGKASHRARSVLVASQVSFALILLVGAGLMLRSFQALQRVDAGYDPEDVLVFRVSLPDASYPDAVAVAAFHTELLARIQAIPGVSASGAVSQLPLSREGASDPVMVKGRPLDPDDFPPVMEARAATPGYFEAMGIPLLGGRMFEGADADGRSGAVLVSERLVEVFFPGEEPLQKQIAHGIPQSYNEWSTIVGVVGDVHNVSLTEDPMGAVYYAILPGEGVDMEWLTPRMSYAVKTSVPPTSIMPAIRRALSELDSSLPLSGVQTMEDRTRDARAQMAFTMLMLAIASAVGLALGVVGLYGVVSYVTSQRTREIGVRLALGAEAGAVRAMILRQGMAVIALGLVVGLIGAYALSRFMEALLFQVNAKDPITFAIVTAILAAVSIFATWLPAARAAGTDPVRALRWE